MENVWLPEPPFGETSRANQEVPKVNCNLREKLTFAVLRNLYCVEPLQFGTVNIKN